jgi:hypothetical protein
VGCFKVLPHYLLRENEGNKRISVMAAGLRAENQTQDFPNTELEF